MAATDDETEPMAEAKRLKRKAGGHAKGATSANRLDRVKRQLGGQMPPAAALAGQPPVSPDQLARVRAALALRAQQNPAAMAQGAMPVGAGVPVARPGLMPSQMPQRSPSGFAKGGKTDGKFIEKAIKHPGRMKKGAEREGVSTRDYMEEHKGDAGGRGSAARLGLRLAAMSKGKD